MPRKGGVLTPQERAFAKSYAVTGDRTGAARAAGYATPHMAGSKALARPAVRSLVDELFVAELQGEIVPLALKRHKEILRDPKSTGPALTKAIEAAYKYGFAKRETAIDKELHEMTMGELQALIRASEAAQIVEGEVVETVMAAAPVVQAEASSQAAAPSLEDVFG